MPKQSMLEQVADELAQWVEEMSDSVAEGLMEGGRSPFTAQATEAEKLDYYERLLFLPDGQPNAQGRAALMERLTTEDFIRVMNAVARKRAGVM
jgi:hypothetical protein